MAFELQSTASLKVPRAQMLKRINSESIPPRIMLGVNLTKHVLRQSALLPPSKASDNVEEVFKCLLKSAWRWASSHPINHRFWQNFRTHRAKYQAL